MQTTFFKVFAPTARVFLTLALAFGGGCAVVGSRTHNLRELHGDDGHHVRVGRVMNGSTYFVEGIRAQIQAKLQGKEQSEVRYGSPSAIDDPASTCVENLLALASFQPSDEGTVAIQVEYFARFSASDPWQISRQICMEQLGHAGARLMMERHAPRVEDTTQLATPETLRDALAPLVPGLVPREGSSKPKDVASALAAIGGLNYDLDGILRSLAACSGLLRQQAPDSPHRPALLALVLDLERRTVRLALERGVADTDPHVRAQAIAASVRANGPAYLSKFMPRLGTDAGEAVPLAILELVRSQGLSAEKPGEIGGQSPREGELALLVRVATEHPVDRVRVSAMLALSDHSGAGFASLREDDWDHWWQSRGAPKP